MANLYNRTFTNIVIPKDTTGVTQTASLPITVYDISINPTKDIAIIYACLICNSSISNPARGSDTAAPLILANIYITDNTNTNKFYITKNMDIDQNSNVYQFSNPFNLIKTKYNKLFVEIINPDPTTFAAVSVTCSALEA
jgi:hypothetical protein